MKNSLVLMAILLIICAGTALHAQTAQPMIGQAAPSFELKGVDGNNYSLSQLKGKLVLIHFATTWCPFCNAEAPNLEELYQSYKDKGIQVFLIDVKENKALVEQSFKRYNLSFPVLLDEDGKVATAYSPPGVLPDLSRDEVVLASNLIIDKEGKIRFYSLLNTTAFDAKLLSVRKKLDELLNEQ
ncbi:redoxin domain-containing protein [Pseudoflavitalea sp. X16]|uniref:peroxiredoxin family protein n=1 Tax=Paraflavitalea devenefica TaxID=2716334 RepID=UPI001423A742|nr:redoxin domain-containing protein [Paraflavitalea devenefica]NII26359.1 redoxin domain-containing protein [Paraflavitalea devenefica]